MWPMLLAYRGYCVREGSTWHDVYTDTDFIRKERGKREERRGGAKDKIRI